MADRHSQSLAIPILFVILAAGSAVFAGYAWWQQKQYPPTVVAGTLPATYTQSVQRNVPGVASRTTDLPVRTASAGALRKCVGVDGVPIYTNLNCPHGSALEKTIAIEIPRNARGSTGAYPTSRTSRPPDSYSSPANAAAYEQPYIPPRKLRDDIAMERAFDRCEQAKVDEELALQRLGNKRTLRDIRRWEKRTVDICAEYKMLTAR